MNPVVQPETATGVTSGPTEFYAAFQLDPVRCIRQLGEIAEHVTARLGPDVEITLEVRARNSDGFDDATRRTVSENATNLGSRSSEIRIARRSRQAEGTMLWSGP